MDPKDVDPAMEKKSGHKRSPYLLSVLPYSHHHSLPRFNSRKKFAYRAKVLEDHFRDPHQEERLVAALSVEQKSSYFLLKEWWEGRTCNEFNRRAMRALERKSEERKDTYFDVLATLYETELSGDGRLGILKRSKQSGAAAKHTLWALRQRAALFASYQRIALDTASLANCTFTSPPRIVRPPFNATVDPGFWIDDPEDEQYPFYLWDAQRRVTVETSELKATLGSIPEYAAICHTWGHRINKVQDPISVPGTLWEIPYVDNCDIMNLPSLLSTLPSRYVWIDWFCIPQVVDPKNKERQSRKEMEIKKQPSGLRRAKTVFAWFDNIDEWSVMPDVINYFGLRILQVDEGLQSGDAGSLQDTIALVRERLGSTSELVAWSVCDTSDIDTAIVLTNDFFLSQWVLQECCVRPDMLMADAKFRVLKTAADSDVHIDDVAAIARADIRPEPGQTQLPQAVRQTLLAFRKSGMHHLPATQGLAVLPEDETGASWFGAQLMPQENPKQLTPAPPDPYSSRGT